MRKFSLLPFLFLLSEQVFCQCDSLYFRITATAIFDMVAFDTSHLLAVGDNGYVIKSADGGNSWRNIPTFQPNYLFAVSAPTDSILYAVGSWKTILKSEDQGETWYPLFAKTTSTFTTPTAWLNDVFFLTKDKGYIVGDYALLYSTTDGGQTWKDTTFSTVASSRLECVTFVNDKLGFIAGGGTTMYRTKNGGSTWQKINLDFVGFNQSINKIKFLDTLTGFAVSSNGYCIKTTDGGDTWNRMNTPYAGGYSDIDFLDNQVGFIVGTYTNGTLLKTTDGGNNWTMEWNSFATYSSGSVLAIDKTKKKVVFAGGGSYADVFGYNGRTIISTSDTGVTYKQLSANARVDYHALYFINDSTGYIAGDGGTFFKTSDYGESWKPLQKIQSLLGGNSTRSLFFVDEQNGYAASDLLYRTSDGGNSWTLTTIPGGNQQVFVNHMYFFNPQEGVVMDNYHIYRTSDGGSSWKTVLDTPYVMRDMWFTPAGKGFAVGYEGITLVSEDKGLHWSRFTINNAAMFTGVYFYNNSLGFIGTSDSVLYKTTDGGTSWTWLNTGTHRTEMRSFFFESDSLGYMMCNNNGGISGILKTKDGGRTWRSERGIIENVTSFGGLHTIYIAGGAGFIAKTDHRYKPNIPGYIYGPAFNCQNQKSAFFTGPLTGVDFTWNLSGGGSNSFNQNSDTVLWNNPGNYILSVTTSNVCGTSPPRQVAITVNPATAINSQPVTQSVCAGSTANFSVAATGTALQYQWQKGGNDITGATSSSYSLQVADSTAAGDYFVKVTGLCGSVLSSAAKLTVLSKNACTTAVVPVNDLVEKVMLAPNPVLSNAVLKISAKKPQGVQFEVVDMNGRTVLKFSKILARGENKFDLNLAALGTGIYQLYGKASGDVLMVVRFVKN